MKRATLYVIKKNQRVTLAIKAVRKEDTLVAIITYLLIAFLWRWFIAVCTILASPMTRAKPQTLLSTSLNSENQDLGVVKALRTPVPKLDLSPFPLPPLTYMQFS